VRGYRGPRPIRAWITKTRRKAPGFSYGDIRRGQVALQCPRAPENDGRSVREVRIIPAHNARFFAVEFVATNIGPVDQPSLDQNRIPGIDPGVNNLAACAATTG